MDDVIYVLVEAGDGPVFIPHSAEQFERLIRGVDLEAAWNALAPLTDERDEAHRSGPRSV